MTNTTRAARKAQATCRQCDNKFYARGLCKHCYMKEFRARQQDLGSSPKEPIDPEDLWLFVKKELNIG